ncbi:disks large-associated protein 4-like [Haemaphysalis longicornis]
MFTPTSEAVPPSDPTTREGHVFLAALSRIQESLELEIKMAQSDMSDQATPEEVKGHIMAAIGKANLLITQKFSQFRELCRRNIEPRANDSFQASGSDLAGFWDLVMIQVNDVQASFRELAVLKVNNWKTPGRTDSMKTPLPTSSKETGPRLVTASPCMSSERAQQAAKARAEARKKFIQAKRQLAQQSPAASHDGDVVIFVPPEKNN